MVRDGHARQNCQDDGRLSIYPAVIESASVNLRSEAMGQHRPFTRILVSEDPVPPPVRPGPAKENPHNQAGLDEFERERMGIASRE